MIVKADGIWIDPEVGKVIFLFDVEGDEEVATVIVDGAKGHELTLLYSEVMLPQVRSALARGMGVEVEALTPLPVGELDTYIERRDLALPRRKLERMRPIVRTHEGRRALNGQRTETFPESNLAEMGDRAVAEPPRVGNCEPGVTTPSGGLTPRPTNPGATTWCRGCAGKGEIPVAPWDIRECGDCDGTGEVSR